MDRHDIRRVRWLAEDGNAIRMECLHLNLNISLNVPHPIHFARHFRYKHVLRRLGIFADGSWFSLISDSDACLYEIGNFPEYLLGFFHAQRHI